MRRAARTQQWVWFAFALTLVAASAQAQEVSREEISFPGKSRGKPVRLTGTLSLPGGEGRLPAMVIVHGSGGVSPERESVYAREMASLGVAAFVPDLFTGRGVKSTVEDQAAVTGLEMVADAFTVLEELARHPRLDPKRIGIMGFSKGGTVTLDAALLRYAERFLPSGPRYALHVAFYPSCVNVVRSKATTGAPIHVLSGAADTYVGVKPCADYVAALRTAGANIEHIVYPNAEHGWDGSRAYSLPRGENYSRCVFEEQADGSWVEKFSGIQTTDARGVRIADKYAAALAACRTLGVRGGPNPAVKAQAVADLKRFVRVAFGL